MKRLYEHVLKEHCSSLSQMSFLAGPRQVGKTTLVKRLCAEHTNSAYLNWDITGDRIALLEGKKGIFSRLTDLDLSQLTLPLIALDEIHKLSDWKNYLKGLYDELKDEVKLIVTGSAKLDIFQKGGDSLMGRYFLYRAHPFSVGELIHQVQPLGWTHDPIDMEESLWEALFHFGGFPDPLFKQEQSFLNRWHKLRFNQLIREDINEITQVSELAKMEVLARLLEFQVGAQTNYHHLAQKARVSDKTAKSWLDVLSSFYYCFQVRPWSNNIARSLLKEPKVYLWDWSPIRDEGKKIENFIASHLLKAVHYWTDSGLGHCELFYLRDKDQNEVDFLVVKEGKPWILAEVKKGQNQRLSRSLHYFQKQVQAEHVFQIAFDMPYVDQDCFSIKKPVIVPARTLLSQLI